MAEDVEQPVNKALVRKAVFTAIKQGEDPTELDEKLRACAFFLEPGGAKVIAEAVARGMTLRDYIEADSAAAWLKRFGDARDVRE